MKKLPKIVVFLGPTASGKTELGIFLAKKFSAKGGPAFGWNGAEIISADSRQVYRGMDIGTAKPGEGKRGKVKGESVYVVDGVTHHLIDVVNPDEEFTLADFKKMAEEKIADILKRGKLPIVVGGTGLYIWALVDNLDIPKKAVDEKLRARLNATPLAELLKMLKEKDPDSYNNIDLKNPRRVIRALEVALSGESFWGNRRAGKPLYDALQIGLKWPREVLYERINRRVDKQIEQGLVDEVKKLAQDLTLALSLARRGNIWELPSMSGIGYRQFKEYLSGKETLEEAVEKLKRDTRKYAKRQETWFKRDKRIKWIEGDDRKQAEEEVNKFIK